VTRRPAYTLLEVLLASVIAALLMAGLYVAMDTHLRAVQAGRESVDASTVARQLFAMMDADAAGCLTPITVPPSTAAAAPTASSATSSTASAGTTAAADPGVSTSDVVPFNGGVQGDNGVVTLWVSRVPKLPPPGSDFSGDQQTYSSDLHRISYWLAAAGGLARQDLDRVSASDDSAQLPPGVQDEDQLVVAPEVTEASFQYFDGTNWQDTWDGTVIGADGKTPIGPPRAVSVDLTIRRPGVAADAPNATRHYRHVLIINAANAQPTTADDTTTTGTTGTTTGGTSP
jgi:type II secretory pathway component PulJ